jgi:hypothetical protein
MFRATAHRILGGLAVALVVIACAAPGASVPPSPMPTQTSGASDAPPTTPPTQAPASAEPSLPPPSPTAKPAETQAPGSWPAVPAAPTPDATGTLLLMHVRWSDTGGPAPFLVVLADGRVVTRHEDENGSTSLLKRQLSTAGITFVRAALTDVGLFDQDRTRKLIKPLNCCGAGDQLRVRLGDATVSVGRVLAYKENYAPDPAWDRFDALVDNLVDIEAWLPAEAWADTAWSPYLARRFCLELTTDTYSSVHLRADELAWPAGVRPFASFGVEGASSDSRVGSISSTDAYALAASIVERASAAGIVNEGSYVVPLELGGKLTFQAIRAGGIDWGISLSPRWPQWPDCSGIG